MPLLVEWTYSEFSQLGTKGTMPNRGFSWISPIVIKRGRGARNVAAHAGSIPKIKDLNLIEFSKYTNFERRMIEIDISKFHISGGWIPGKYYLILRIQIFYSPKLDEREFRADISLPIKFEIIE